MPTVIDELVTLLKIEMKPGTKAMVDSFSQGLDKVTRMAAVAGTAITATAASILYFLQRTNESAGELAKFSQITGMATDKLQGLMYGMDKVGGNSDALMGDIKGLVNSMSSPIPGEFNQALFMLGVSAHKAGGGLKSADEMLISIAGRFEGMSKQRQMQWASRIGLSDDTLLLLQQGKEGIRALMQEAADIPTIVDEQALKNAREFTIQMNLMGRTVKYLSQTAASAAGPILKQIVKESNEWLKANRELIQSGIRDFVDGITDGFHKFWFILQTIKDKVLEFLPSMDGLAEKLDLVHLTSSSLLVGLFLLIGAIAILMWEWVALGIAIAAVILIVDDITTYFEGGTSIIGELINKVKELAKAFAEKYPNITRLVLLLWDALKKLGSFTLDALVNAFKDMFKFAYDTWNIIEKIGGWLLKMADQSLGGFFGLYDAYQMGQGGGGLKAGPYLPSGGGNNSTTNNSSVIHQNITGSNPVAIADEVVRQSSGAFYSYPGGLAPMAQ